MMIVKAAVATTQEARVSIESLACEPLVCEPLACMTPFPRDAGLVPGRKPAV